MHFPFLIASFTFDCKENFQNLGLAVIPNRMKLKIFLVAAFYMLSSFVDDKGEFIENVSISKFRYQVFKKHKFQHETNMNTDFFVLYGVANKGTCSSLMLATKNDSVMIKGSYTVYENRIEFKEYYSRGFSGLDSLLKVFYTNSAGELILVKYTEYAGRKSSHKE